MASSSRLRFPLVSLLPLAAAALCVPSPACGDGGGALDVVSGDGGPAGSLAEGGTGRDDSGAPTTTIRLANLAPDLGPVDFCYRAVNTGTFEGPVLGGGATPGKDAGADGDAAADADDAAASSDANDVPDVDAGAPGIAYRTMSTYVTLESAGPITLAIVPRGAGACSNPLLQQDVTLDAGKLSTVVLLGRSADVDGGIGALGLVAFTDDRTTVTNKARVRLVNAALGTAFTPPSGALGVRAVAGQTVSLADAIEPRRASSPSSTVPVDALGYATVAPVPPPASLAIADVGPSSDASTEGGAAGWQSAATDLGLSGGSLHTGFVLTGEGEPFEVLWCTDTSTSADRTTCDRVR